MANTAAIKYHLLRYIKFSIHLKPVGFTISSWTSSSIISLSSIRPCFNLRSSLFSSLSFDIGYVPFCSRNDVLFGLYIHCAADKIFDKLKPVLFFFIVAVSYCGIQLGIEQLIAFAVGCLPEIDYVSLFSRKL